VEEVIEEAHLDPQSIFQGIERFVSDREKRLARLKSWDGEALNDRFSAH